MHALAMYANVYNILCEHELQNLTGSMSSAWLLAGCWDMDLCSLPCARSQAWQSCRAWHNPLLSSEGLGMVANLVTLSSDGTQQKFVDVCLSDVPSASEKATSFICIEIGDNQCFSLSRDRAKISICSSAWDLSLPTLAQCMKVTKERIFLKVCVVYDLFRGVIWEALSIVLSVTSGCSVLMGCTNCFHQLLKLCSLTLCFITRKKVIILDTSRCSHLRKMTRLYFLYNSWVRVLGLSRSCSSFQANISLHFTALISVQTENFISVTSVRCSHRTFIHSFRLHSSYDKHKCMLAEGPATAVIIVTGANREELDYEVLDLSNSSNNMQAWKH